ncbi:MAG: hypothetical protein AB1698_01725 [Pseudomonadota bacterium]
MQGVGAGVRPTGWVAPFTNATGITITPVGGGVEDGIDYSDWDITGTASVDGTVFLYCWGSASDIPATPGQVYSGSLFCKLASGTLAGTTWVGGTGPNGVFLTPYNSALTAIGGGQNTVFTPSSAPLARCRFASENWTTPANTAYVGMYVRFQVTAGVAVNLRLRIGWPQIELGPSASSPIRTTGSAATRAADSFSASILDRPEGTLFIEAATSASAIGGTNGLIQVDNGGTGNRISVYQLGQVDRRLAIYIASGGVASANTAVGSTVTPGVTVRAALSWGAGAASMSVNGSTPVTFSGVALPAVAFLRIGGGGGGVSGNPWGGPVRRGALCARTLSNAELQALTA